MLYDGCDTLRSLQGSAWKGRLQLHNSLELVQDFVSVYAYDSNGTDATSYLPPYPIHSPSRHTETTDSDGW